VLATCYFTVKFELSVSHRKKESFGGILETGSHIFGVTPYPTNISHRRPMGGGKTCLTSKYERNRCIGSTVIRKNRKIIALAKHYQLAEFQPSEFARTIVIEEGNS
jgi:hypothetical protein